MAIGTPSRNSTRLEAIGATRGRGGYRRRGIRGVRAGTAPEARPPTGALHAERRGGAAAIPAVERPPPARWSDERPQTGEPVRGHEAAGGQLSEGVLDLCPQQTGVRGQFLEAEGAAPRKKVEHGARVGGQPPVFIR